MNGFGSFPRVSELLVSAGADVARNETVHGLSRDFSSGLASVGDLGNLRIEDSLLVRVDLECGKHVNLLDEQRRSVLLSQLLSDSSQDAC